jgi:hypothetical protein
MRVVVEAASNGHRALKRIFARVSERWMAQVVGQAERFSQVLVKSEHPRHRTPDLSHFEAVSQPNPIVVAVRSDEHLRFVAESAEGDGMNDPVAVALEDVARASWRPIGFRMGPAAGFVGIRGK